MTTTLTPAEVAGKEVRVWMAREDITQKQLAKVLGISQGSLSEKLRGKIAFNLNDLVIISGALNITLAELLGEGILNAKIPTTTQLSNDGDKKIAPVGFIPTGATYQVVAGAGFEPAASGLQDPMYRKVVMLFLILQKILPHSRSSH